MVGGLNKMPSESTSESENLLNLKLTFTEL